MFDFFKKLMLARQIKFERGRIYLLKNPVTIINPTAISYLIANSKNKMQSGREIYYASKESFRETFAKYIKINYKLKTRELIEIMFNLAMMTGWGEWKLIQLDEKKPYAIVHVYKSPIVEAMRKKNIKMDYVVDHMVRGFVAGACDIIFKMKTDSVETKCMGMGDPFCEFIMKATEEWRKETNKFRRDQLFQPEK